MALTGAEIKAKYLTEAEKNKNMHNPIPTTPKVNTPVTASPAPTGYQPPDYGSNVQGYDANNAQHTALADAGQQWATAKASGDTAGMSAAAALGQQIRSGVQGSSYDSVKGISALPTPQPVQQPVQPQATALPSGGYSPPSIMDLASASDLQREAAANMDKQRTGLKQGIDKFIADLQAGYDYSQQGTRDNRALQDFQQSNSVNPFTQGKQTWDKGIVGRQRTIEDGATERNFNNELTAVKQQMLDFDRMAPEQQEAIYQNLKRIERDYGVNLGQVMGEIDGKRTLAGQAQDYAQSSSNPANVALNIQNQIAQLDLNSYPEQIKLGLDKLKQEVATGNLNQQEAEYKLKELTDPNSMTNQTKALDLQMKELEAKNLPEKERLAIQTLKKQLANIGVQHYKPQTAAEKEYDEQQVLKIKAEIAKIEGSTGTPVKMDAKESVDNVQGAKAQIEGKTMQEALSYAMGTKDYYTDADYKALILYINENF